MVPSVDVLSILITLLAMIGVPVLLVMFYFEGLIVGKVARPAAVFVLYLLVFRPSQSDVIVAAVLCAVATTLGQWTMYRGFNRERPELIGLQRRVSYFDRAPEIVQEKIGQRQMEIVTRTFDRFGGVAVCLSNVVPGIRGLMSIPAGLSRYPVERFLAFSLVGNGVYMAVLVLISEGILSVGRLFPWI